MRKNPSGLWWGGRGLGKEGEKERAREPRGETVRLLTVLFIGESLLTVLNYR